MKKAAGPVSSSSLVSEFIKKALAIKYYYLGLVFLFVAIAYFLNKYSNNVYQVDASILITQKNQSSFLNSNELFKNVDFFQNTKNIENEVTMLTSFALISNTITNLNYEVGYYLEKDGIIKRTKEIVEESPFIVGIDKSHVQPIDVPFYIDILSDSTFRLSASQKLVSYYNYVDNKVIGHETNFKINNIYKFNQTITTDAYSFTINAVQKNPSKSVARGTRVYFRLFHLDYITMAYMSTLKVEPISQLASIINISFKGENVTKITTFLNKYIELYLGANLEKKNKASTSTISFIDSQISQISDSLVSAESKLKSYKSANQVMDLSFQGQRIYDQMTQMETERANMQVQKRYYNYIINYFDKNKDMTGLVPPSSMNVVDPIMNQMITELLSLNVERASIINTNSQKNLFLGDIENKIKMQKDAILENVKNNLNTLNLSINELNYRFDKLSGEISKLPKTELRLVGMERKYKLNDAIYNFLLQKRAEAEIAKESNFPDYEILNPARDISAFIIYPKKGLNLIIALFLALLLPSFFIIVRDFFNDKFISVYDIEHVSKHEVIGVIYNNKHKTDLVVAEYPRSSVAESFRTLRTILFIKLNVDTSKVILVTSSMPGEGKSFVSANLSASIASMGYKTVVIDCDLRKSTLHQKFNIDNSIGLSSYLVNKALIDDILIETPVPNLSFIPAGPLFPNPAELFKSEIADKLFSYLKTQFDYIIIDTPPLGAVADSYLLMKYATHSLIISRQNYTRKDIFVDVISGLESNSLHKFDIVMNDLNFKKSSYGQHYGKYYSEEKPKEKGFQNLSKKFSKKS